MGTFYKSNLASILDQNVWLQLRPPCSILDKDPVVFPNVNQNISSNLKIKTKTTNPLSSFQKHLSNTKLSKFCIFSVYPRERQNCLSCYMKCNFLMSGFHVVFTRILQRNRIQRMYVDRKRMRRSAHPNLPGSQQSRNPENTGCCSLRLEAHAISHLISFLYFLGPSTDQIRFTQRGTLSHPKFTDLNINPIF